MLIKIALRCIAKRWRPGFRTLVVGSVAMLHFAGSTGAARAEANHEARFEGAVLSLVEATPLAVSLVGPAIALDEDERLFLLTVDLSPGWKTYWRLPGRFGLAPTWNWTNSANVGDLTVHYPAPVLFEEADGSSIGYDAMTVWPIVVRRIDASAPLRLDLSLSFGLCADLCIPETAQFSVGAGDNTGVSPPLSLLAALAAQLPEDGGPFDSVVGTAIQDAIYVLEGAEGQHVMVASEQGRNDGGTLRQAIQSNWPFHQPAIWLHVIEPGRSIQSYDLGATPPTSSGQ